MVPLLDVERTRAADEKSREEQAEVQKDKIQVHQMVFRIGQVEAALCHYTVVCGMVTSRSIWVDFSLRIHIVGLLDDIHDKALVSVHRISF